MSFSDNKKIVEIVEIVSFACDCDACSPFPGDTTKDAKDYFKWSMGRFRVCGTCGNKRCIRKKNHVLPCTGSNDPVENLEKYKKFCTPEDVERDRRNEEYYAQIWEQDSRITKQGRGKK